MTQVVPRARLIVLLRDPVDRAYSSYHHQVRVGRETLGFEEAMLKGGLLGDDFIASYQRSDDIYKRYLEKLLKALKTIGEPHADEKLQAVIEELATMGPAVFLTPWELTLKYLDAEYGNFNDIKEFYKTASASEDHL